MLKNKGAGAILVAKVKVAAVKSDRLFATVIILVIN